MAIFMRLVSLVLIVTALMLLGADAISSLERGGELTVRSLGTPVRSVDRLVEAGDLMGQELFQPPSVKGWPGGR